MTDFTGPYPTSSPNLSTNTSSNNNPQNPSSSYDPTSAAGLDPLTFNIQAAANISRLGITSSDALNIPTSDADLTDVNFTPTWFPNVSATGPVKYNFQSQGGGSGGYGAGSGWTGEGQGQGQGQGRYGS